MWQECNPGDSHAPLAKEQEPFTGEPVPADRAANFRPFPLAMQHFYSFVPQACHWWCAPLSAASIHLSPRSVTAGVRLFICLPGLSLLVSALFVGHAAFLFISHCWCPPFSAGDATFLFICFPGLSLLVSALFRWACSISIHLFPGSVTGAAALFRWPCSISIHLSPL